MANSPLRKEDGKLHNQHLSLLNKIIDKRIIPGFLVLDRHGKTVFWNNICQQVLNDVVDHKHTMQKIAESVLAERKNLVAGTDTNSGFIQLVVRFNERDYSIRGFRLSGNSAEYETTVGVLIEEISTDRLDLSYTSDLYKFAPREVDVIRELKRGRTDKMIAAKLQISPETVHGYLKSIRAKLGVSTRTEILYRLSPSKIASSETDDVGSREIV